MLILSRAALLQGAPLPRDPHPTSIEQTSCYRCHLAWQHPGKPSWVFIIKSRLPKCGFLKAVATVPPLWEGTLLPPWADEMPQGSLPIGGMEAAPCAPFPRPQQGLLPLEPQPLGPAKPELASLTASYMHWLEQGSSKTREVAKSWDFGPHKTTWRTC